MSGLYIYNVYGSSGRRSGRSLLGLCCRLAGREGQLRLYRSRAIGVVDLNIVDSPFAL